MPLPRSCTRACSPALGRRGFETRYNLCDWTRSSFSFGGRGLSVQNCRVHTKVPRKRDLKPSMVALEGDKFMKGIMVAAGATLDGEVWEPHFVPFTVKMASPKYHGLLVSSCHNSATPRKWRSDEAKWRHPSGYGTSKNVESTCSGNGPHRTAGAVMCETRDLGIK